MGDLDFEYDQRLLYGALVKSTDDYIYLSNMRDDTFCFPQNMVDEFDLPGQIVPEATKIWTSLIHPEDRAAFTQTFEELLSGKTREHNAEYRVKNRGGEWVWLRCRGYLERDGEGNPVLFAGIISNLGRRSKVDPVTSLFTMTEFTRDIELQYERGRGCGVMILGLDGFKHINELYSREAGDAVLRHCSRKIQELLPPGSALYRLDGDRFGLLLRDGNRESLGAVYQKIQEKFSRQQVLDGMRFFCTVSAGGAVSPQDASGAGALFQCAEYALEYSKRGGKNRISFFSEKILKEKSRALELTELLRESVENGCQGFELYYQPQVHAETRKLKGAEALARWSCTRFGSVSPGEFIPLLEESGMIVTVGKWIFEKAIQTCREWQQLQPGFTMSINLSYQQLSEESFIPFMKEALEKEGLDPSTVIVEMTESCIASATSLLHSSFAKIREIGIRIAMDDFGTGYSSLAILKNAPADVVKIDRAFVRDILNSRFDATFIQFVVALCHNVDIEVCLEGVEVEEEYDRVFPMQLDLIQGFLFGKPQAKEDFLKQWFHSPQES